MSEEISVEAESLYDREGNEVLGFNIRVPFSAIDGVSDETVGRLVRDCAEQLIDAKGLVRA